MAYIWAAYRQGSLASMGGVFSEPTMDTDEFRTAFTLEVLHDETAKYHAAWTLFAETGRGFVPVGLVLGFWSHPDPALAPFMIIGDMLWFSWASKRNRVETAVRFFSAIRSEFPVVEYAKAEDRPFFEMLMKHGIMRRVGTSHSVYPDEAVTIFETRV